MFYSAGLLTLGSLAIIETSSASPLESRTTVKCNDVTTGLDPSCWATLNMTKWLNNWSETTPGASGDASIEDPVGSFSSSVSPTMTSSVVSSMTSSAPNGFASGGDLNFRRTTAGCNQGEAWSTCFLRLGLGKAGEDCTTIRPQSCTAPQAGQSPHTPEIYYGVWNIYAINDYITTIYDALETLLQSNTQAITNAAEAAPGGIAFDFDPKHPMSVDGVLIQLLLKETNNKSLPGAINTPLVTYLEKTPSTQTYNQSTSVNELTESMQTSLTNALNMVMTDLPTFEAFASNGAFSTTQLPKSADLVKDFAS